MKRIFCLLIAAMLLVLCACGGSPAQSGSSAGTSTPADSSAKTEPTPALPDPPPETPVDPVPPVSDTPAAPAPVEPKPPVSSFTNPLTGLPTENDIAGRKPIAIMLNNIKAAQPQQGNSQADMIYEILAEGGITRMLGLYQDISGLGVVGSVRSARLYYLELALGHDAVFVHAGGSPEFYEKSSAWKLTTVDGVNGFYSYASTALFWRDKNRVEGKDYKYEHSLITSGEKLTAVLGKQGLLKNHADDYCYEMTFAPDGTPVGGKDANALTVSFSGSKSTIFRYDSASGVYKAEQYGSAYIDGNDGTQISATNVLVLQTECTVMDSEGRLDVDLSSGSGWFACGGKYIPITWEKGERDQQMRYFTTDGQPLTLGQGKSYVCIIPENRQIVVE